MASLALGPFRSRVTRTLALLDLPPLRAVGARQVVAVDLSRPELEVPVPDRRARVQAVPAARAAIAPAAPMTPTANDGDDWSALIGTPARHARPSPWP